jgi:hypothetical protein
LALAWICTRLAWICTRLACICTRLACVPLQSSHRLSRCVEDMPQTIFPLTLPKNTLTLWTRLRIQSRTRARTEPPHIEVSTTQLCIISQLLNCVHLRMNCTMEIARPIRPGTHSICCGGNHLSPQHNRSNMGKSPLRIDLGSRSHRLQKIVLDLATHGMRTNVVGARDFNFA